MASLGDVEILKAESTGAPKGTVRDVVNEKCLIFLEVSGLDLSGELAKLEKKATSAQKMVASYETKMAVEGYEERVPKDVRDMNTQKHQASQAEHAELLRAIESLKEAMG